MRNDYPWSTWSDLVFGCGVLVILSLSFVVILRMHGTYMPLHGIWSGKSFGAHMAAERFLLVVHQAVSEEVSGLREDAAAFRACLGARWGVIGGGVHHRLSVGVIFCTGS